MKKLAAITLGWVILIRYPLPGKRGERGLSQSTENAILLVGAVLVAAAVIAAVKGLVDTEMEKVKAGATATP